MILGFIFFLKCINMDFGMFNGIVFVIVVKVINLFFVGKLIFKGKWVWLFFFVFKVLGNFM